LALQGSLSPDGEKIGASDFADFRPGAAGAETREEEQEPGGNLADKVTGYRLLEEIGHGGCGVVYMAEQEKPVRRRVALKVVKIGMDTRQVVARFDAERQVLARMDHPNIAKVLDAGATDRGRPFFAMELVGGLKITEYCDQNRLTTDERLQLFVQVCRAIQHAHQKGIIHRDIKPSNILVARHDGVAIPKVIDFGIAKATQGKLGDQTVFTSFEQFLGTPVYMSPEQAEPGGLDVDTRSDIYSLGVLLYELLTGKTPFDVKSSNAADVEAVRRTVLEKEPVRPSTRLNAMREDQLTRVASARQIDAPKLIRVIRGDLDWIVMKCLEKDRGRRYETANGLALDLQRYLRQEPVLARPPSAGYRVRKFISRNRLAALSAAAISLSLILGTALSTWLAVKARHAEREQRRLLKDAQAARQQATEELWASCLAEARAQRISQQAGASFNSLAAIAKAAAIRSSLELRNEAIAACVQPDMRWVNGKHFDGRTSVAVNPLATCYAICDDTGAVSVHAITNDTRLTSLPEAKTRANGVWFFSPDGSKLAVSYAGKDGRVWDWQRSECLLEIPSCEGLDFSPDSQQLAAGAHDRVLVYDLSKKKSVPDYFESVELLDGPWALRYHPNGKFIAAFNELHTNVVVLDLVSGKRVMDFVHDDGVHRVAWSPDGRYLASTCVDNFLHLWDTQSGREVSRVPAHQGLSLAFNPQGTVLACAGWDGRTRLWDLLKGRLLVTIYKSGEISRFTPDGRMLVETPWTGRGFDLFEVANPEGLRTLYTHESDRRGPSGVPAFSQDGRLLAFATPEGIRVWDNQSQKEIGLTGNEDTSPIGFDAGDRHLIVADPEGLMICQLQRSGDSHYGSTGLEITAEVSLKQPVRIPGQILAPSGGVSSDGEHCFLVGSNRCEIRDTRTFTRSAITGVHPGMRFLAVNHDASLIASGAWLSPGVIVWDGHTGEQIKSFQNPDTTSVIFSPDGHYLVAATAERYIFWQVGSWVQVLSIPQQANNDFVPMMAFSHDGRIFAGTHSRDTVRLHDAATGEVLADLEPPDPHMVTGLCFNSDGSNLAVCEGSEATRIWDLQVIRSRLAPLGLDWKLSTSPAR
jgi:serine/threonine protein kinase/WD40 repeat protein